MRKKILRYVLTLLLGCLFTSILFIPSFNMDGICTKYYGYDLTSLNFLGAGRLLTYVTYIFFSIIKLPLNVLSIASILLSNIFLSVAVIDVYEIVSKSNNKLLFILSFLLVYNPITLELFLFDESFIMCLGILFGVKAVKILNTDIKTKSLISLLFTSLCTMCYQGILCIFLPIGFLNIILNNRKSDRGQELKNIVIDFLKLVVIYAGALIINFVIMKFINVFIIDSKKSGTLNLLDNIIFCIKFCFESIKTMGGYANVKIYYLINVLLMGCGLVSLITKKVDKKYILYLFVTLMLAVCCPFVINLAMNTKENYTAARMYMSIGFMTPILAIYLYKYFNILQIKGTKILFYSLITTYFVFVGYNYIIITKGGLDSYKMDIAYMNNLEKEIVNYETETGNVINNVYWSYDKKSEFCNDVGFCNSYSYRFFATDWSAESAIGVLNTKEQLNYIEMSEYDKNTYFKDKIDIDYTYYSREQLVFDKNNLYLLIY